MSQKIPFTEKRPWGEFRQFSEGENVTVKIITVKKGESLSLQKHNKRSEFWRILKGTPLITNGDETVEANIGDEFLIGIGVNHRVEARVDDVEFLEVSRGEFQEGDIERLEDKYGRS